MEVCETALCHHAHLRIIIATRKICLGYQVIFCKGVNLINSPLTIIHKNLEMNSQIILVARSVKFMIRFFQWEALQHSEAGTCTNAPVFNSFLLTTEDELKKIIMSSNSKSCTLDPIPTSILKQCLDCLLPILVKIVNL